MTYEYARIGRLAESLASNGIPEDVAAKIMEGGESIRKGDKPAKKTAWMKAAMERMDSLLDLRTRKMVREDCACALGGSREQAVKRIAKAGGTLAERVKKANETPLVFGNGVELRDDGSIVVSFFPEGKEQYRCVCLKGVSEPLSVTYCYCCGGHVKHHMQTALGQELECDVVSSALSSGGKKGCKFWLTPKETN